MRLTVSFSEKAFQDLVWIETDLTAYSEAGRSALKANFSKTLELISQNPLIGKAVADFETVREFLIIKSNYTFFYSVTASEIIILRIWDQRANPIMLETYLSGL